MVKSYRKKPVEVEAIQWLGNDASWERVQEWIGQDERIGRCWFDKSLYIDTLEGEMIAGQYDYIVKGVEGEYYPVREDIFKKTYEEA